MPNYSGGTGGNGQNSNDNGGGGGGTAGPTGYGWNGGTATDAASGAGAGGGGAAGGLGSVGLTNVGAEPHRLLGSTPSSDGAAKAASRRRLLCPMGISNTETSNLALRFITLKSCLRKNLSIMVRI